MNTYKELMNRLFPSRFGDKIDRLTLYVNFKGESTAIYHSGLGRVKQQIPYSCLSLLSRDIALEETVKYQKLRTVPTGLVIYYRFSLPYSTN